MFEPSPDPGRLIELPQKSFENRKRAFGANDALDSGSGHMAAPQAVRIGGSVWGSALTSRDR